MTSILCSVCIQQAEDVVLYDSACDSSSSQTSVQSPAKDDDMQTNKEERKPQESVETVSVEVQTDPLTDRELLSLQQQPVETVSVEVQTDPLTDRELLSLQQQKM